MSNLDDLTKKHEHALVVLEATPLGAELVEFAENNKIGYRLPLEVVRDCSTIGILALRIANTIVEQTQEIGLPPVS